MKHRTSKTVERKSLPQLPEKVVTAAFTGMTLAGSMVMGMPMAFADGNATSVVEGIQTLVKYLGILLGIVYGIFGFLHYAQANAEGDGPAKNKAQNQLAAAVMLMAVGIIVGLVNFKGMVPSNLAK